MDVTLPLQPLHPLLPTDRPFTPAMARAAGVERSALDRMVRTGTVRRLVRGAYAAAGVPDDTTTRAAAVALVTGPRAVVVDRTAAWLHGLEIPGAEEVPTVEVVTPVGTGRGAPGCSRQLSPRDVQRLGAVRLTTPLRTALDLGRLLAPDLALGSMDALLAGGGFTHVQLLAELPRMAGLRGVGRLRTLAAQVDGRSAGFAESALRLRWHQARLPTAVPGLAVSAGGRVVRLSLGVERRQFGAVLAGQVGAADLDALQGAGWRVAVLTETRVLGDEPERWMRHLEREFHQQLLAQAG